MHRLDKKNTAMLFAGWLFILAVMMAMWSLPLRDGRLKDPDDYMRMTRIFAILDGHHDPSYAAPRLGVDGSEIGWSRLVDWPLAFMQGGMEFFAGRYDAALVTTTLMPALALLLFFAAAYWYAGPLIPRRRAVFVFFAIMLLWGVLRQFLPGRVDHHMWQIVLGVTAYGALLRLWFTPARLLYAFIAGLAFATGLAVGADILPWFAFGAALSGFFWLVRGAEFQKPNLVFGLGTFGAAFVYHLLLHDHGRFLAASCDSLALPWLAIAALVPVFWCAITVLPAAAKHTAARRFLSGSLIAAILLALLYKNFPACLTDPYQIADPQVRRIWLDAVLEARALPAFYETYPALALIFIIPPLLALAAALVAARKEKDNRPLWIGLALVLTGGLALTFFQVRTADFVLAAAVAPLAWLCAALFDGARAMIARLNMTRGQRLAAEAIFFVVALTLTITAMTAKRGDKADATTQTHTSCAVAAAAPALNEIPGALTIAAYIDSGSEILYRTHHRVLAAPYHRDHQGILAAYKILSAPDAQTALVTVRETHTGLIMLCDDPANSWTKDSRFAHDLLQGALPAWLESAGQGGGYMIFKVKGDN